MSFNICAECSTMQVSALQTSAGRKYSLKMSRVGDLESFADDATGHAVTFKYLRSTRLMSSRFDSPCNSARVFAYDDFGRLTRTVAPTGHLSGLRFNLTSEGGAVHLSGDDEESAVLRMGDRRVDFAGGASVAVDADKSIRGESPWGQSVEISTVSHPVIGGVMASSFPMPASRRVYLGSNLVSEAEWTYTVAKNGHNGNLMGMKKALRVNGGSDQLLAVHFDRLQRREVFYKGKKQILEIRYVNSHYSRRANEKILYIRMYTFPADMTA